LITIEIEDRQDEDSNIHIFYPNSEQFYHAKSLLTIDNENEIRTLRITQWLNEDPIAFDKIRRENNLKISREVFESLISKLRANHQEYFRNALGLHARINFKGYDKPVQAIVPYKNNPVEFYKWWCLNSEFINMSLSEKIHLFDKVYMEDKNALKKEHRRIIRN